MSHSVVKVTESIDNDSLYLLVGEDGTVTPDKETVDEFLKSREGPTNVQLMHMTKAEGRTIELSVENLTYIHTDEDQEPEPQEVSFEEMDEVARNLFTFRLDHDYTPLTSPKHSPTREAEPEPIDELAETLSLLDGGGVETAPIPVAQSKTVKPTLKTQIVKKISVTQPQEQQQPTKQKTAKILDVKLQQNKLRHAKTKTKDVEEIDYDEENEESEEESEENDDDDSDFELEEPKQRATKRLRRTRSKSSSEKKPFVKTPKAPAPPKPKTPPAAKPAVEEKPVEKPETPQTAAERKPVKKEKKAPKPIPDDFALFSTPDIIRRVGGKEPTTPESPVVLKQPAKISPENRSKSNTERNPSVSQKTTRLSVDSKTAASPKFDKVKPSLENNVRRTSTDKIKSVPKQTPDQKTSVEIPKSFSETESTDNNANSTETAMDTVPTTEDMQSVMLSDNSANTLPEINMEQPNIDQSNMNLEAAGLDLDQSILDNINSDMISDDILYQVAKQLVDNTDLQNAIDKSIAEGNLVLDPALMATGQDVIPQSVPQNNQPSTETYAAPPAQKGTQIVRPDGRIVIIPPIERPTTRSRNKKEAENAKVVNKPIIKPLDEEHVSGNELDSSESEEDKSEDDPDKLWCICNQPHNNRFMICCDTCEEWYHGKCVNVTKAMGQLMEQEGREWICVYCKDPSLKRPKAAARRIRKASKASTDSSGSVKKAEQTQSQNSVLACIVCGKPSRKNSIYCSEACILKHAQGVERVVVFDRASGKILSGNKAPSAANIEKWLKEHPTYEVVRSTSKNIQNNKPLTQSKLKLVKNTTNNGVSVAVQKKGVNIGVLQHSPKAQMKQQQQPQQKQTANPVLKTINKKAPQQQSPQQQPKMRILNAEIAQKLQVTPTKPKIVQTTLKTVPLERKEREKVAVQKTPKAKQEPSPQPKHQESIRENVCKTLSEQLMNRLKEAKDLVLSEEEVSNISTEIESQLYKCFGDTGQKYKNKYRSLIFNIKDGKNQTLWRRICEKSISPYQLVRLSPDDMASQELALWRERETKHQLDMIKKSELELLNCNRQYVFKTHKGEQVLEDDRPNDSIDSTEVIASLGADSTSLDSSESKQDAKDKDKKNSKHSKKDKERDHRLGKDKSERDHKKRHRSSSKDRDKRRRSRSKDRSSRHSERKRSKSRERDRHRHSSHKSSRHKKEIHVSTEKLDKRSKEILEQLVDKQIVPPLEDRLWKHVPQEDIIAAPAAESDSDHEPSSTVTIPTPPRNTEPEEPPQSAPVKEEKEEETTDAVVEKDVDKGGVSPPRLAPDFIWKGSISMVDVAQISITAHEVSGDCNGLGDELPANLEIVGRISPDTVWDYIGKMKCSNSKSISLLRLNATNVEEKMPYIALYSYLSSRNRLGVVKSTNKAVKDFYVLPLAVQKPIPQALLPINGPGFEESRPPLLLGIIVRDKKKRALMMEPSHHVTKRVRVEIDIPQEPPVVAAPAIPARSYTPPPSRDPRIKQPYAATPPPVSPTEEVTEDAATDDMDEPYSPEDSDPDTVLPSTDPTKDTTTVEEIPLLTTPVKTTSFLDSSLSNAQTFEPFANKFDTIPGLEDTALPSSSQELQKKMEELDQRIAMQKAEIDNMSQDIVSTATASADIGTGALANISLPSNLQQILDNIKTIGSAISTDSQDSQGSGSDNASTSGIANTADLTIPLMLPKIGSRPVPKPPEPPINTIPLNIPTKPKRRINTTPPPISLEPEKASSVLSTLTEEDLIRKAEEMLGESQKKGKEEFPVFNANVAPPAPPFLFNQPPPPLGAKRPKLDLPPVPGLEDDN